jgi:ribose 5-phosphate isomerase RpiB
MNIICIGARVIDKEEAIKIIEIFLSAKFNVKEKKYKRRLDKLINIEKKFKK